MDQALLPHPLNAVDPMEMGSLWELRGLLWRKGMGTIGLSGNGRRLMRRRVLCLREGLIGPVERAVLIEPVLVELMLGGQKLLGLQHVLIAGCVDVRGIADVLHRAGPERDF